MNDLILLAALLRGPTYGYALKKEADIIFGGTTLHNNVVYPLLKKFIQKGWVKQNTVQGDRGQQRKQHQLTATGRKYLIEQIATFSDREAQEQEAFLFRIALCELLPIGKMKTIVQARKSYLASRKEHFFALKERQAPKGFGAVALARAQAVVEDEVLWIEHVELLINQTKR